MMERIIQRMREYYPVSDASVERLRALAQPMELPRQHGLIEGGVLCGHVYFVERGLCRTYCLIHGNQVNSWFSAEGDFTFAINELYFGEPGFEYVELLEDCLLYAVPIPEFNLLQEENLDFCNWSRVCHQQHLHRTQCSRVDQLTLSAEGRYQKLVAEHPELMQRVPLRHLASYLGVTPQSLSRIRAQLSKR